MFGKWHMGFFKEAYLPLSRGFDQQSGIYNALADHYTHDAYGGEAAFAGLPCAWVSEPRTACAV